jgi:hypothetical protein
MKELMARDDGKKMLMAKKALPPHLLSGSVIK